MSIRYSTSLLGLCLAISTAGFLAPDAAQQWVMPRTPDGHPDLQGTWSNATMTPFQRGLGQGPVYTLEEVAQREQGFVDRVERGSQPSDPNRPAPPAGGDVGSYNQVWFEQGDRVAVVNGEPRTSLITYPSNGRIPALTAEGQERKDEYHGFRDQYGEYDHPELRPLADRCIVFYASSPTATLGPPMTPSGGYNNNIRVIQTARLRGDPRGDDPRHPDHPARRAESIAGPRSALVRRLVGPLGGQHPRGRDHQHPPRHGLQRIKGQDPEFRGSEGDRAHHPARRRQHTLRVRGSRPENLHRGVGRADSLADVRPADLRVRLSRGQLLDVERIAGCALSGKAGGGKPALATDVASPNSGALVQDHLLADHCSTP